METPMIFAKAYAGGLLIGLSATLLLGLNGRIAGISGIVGSALEGGVSGLRDNRWRWAFLAGLLLAALVWIAWAGPLPMQIPVGPPGLIAAGLLVGFGTRLGSGCTSGHGVCGIGRRSRRSIVATLVFIGTGAMTVLVLRLAGVTP